MIAQRFVIDQNPSQVYHRSVMVSEHREIVNGRLIVEQKVRIEHQDPQPLRTHDDLVSMMTKPSRELVATVPTPNKTRRVKYMIEMARRILDL